MLPRPAHRSADFNEACLPTQAILVPRGPKRVHEVKHDGFLFVLPAARRSRGQQSIIRSNL